MAPRVSDLFERRVPQWTAVYIGAGWGLVQFIAFIEQRYLISPHWTDLCLLSLGLLLPSVVLYTYNHGRPGADTMRRSEKVGIPVNLAVAAVVLWMVFGNKDLGAMTTEVTVTGADGETIARELAKPEHRRRVALFGFDAPAAGDTAWVGNAADLALQYELAQDGWLDVRARAHLAERIRETGYEPDQPIPLALKRQIADELNLTHFTHGRIEETTSGYTLSLGLYDVARGRALGERQYSGRDVLSLVDSASIELRRDLELPAAHLDAVEDMPVAERLSSNVTALRAYSRGWSAMIDNDWASAVTHLTEAIDQDPSFSAAAAQLFQARLYTNDQQGAVQALSLAADHAYRLPERMQFYVRAGQYQVQQQPERAIAVLEMAAQLYPDDIEPRMALAMLLPQAKRERDAIRHLGEVVRIDPGQVDRLLDIGGLYASLGQYDSAIDSYDRFVAAAPTRTEGLRAIGEIEALRGNHDAARARFERALLLDPSNVEVHVAMAQVAQHAGLIDEARAHLRAASDAARTPLAAFQVSDASARLSRWLGQPMAAYSDMQRVVEHAARFQPPLIVQVFRMAALKPLTEAGRADEARRQLDDILTGIPEMFGALSSIGILSIETGLPIPDPDRIDAEAQRAEQLIARTGWQFAMPIILGARALAAETRGDYDVAIDLQRRRIELEPTKLDGHIDLARALRLRGDLELAARELQRVLAPRPADPEARYELALVHERAGRSEEAVAELRRALEVWADAEPAYAPAAQARAALDRLLTTRPAGDR